MYSAIEISKYIIDYSCDKGKPTSNLRLQKILYFVQANFLISKNVECFNDNIYAWDFGPVVPSVYFEYKIFGGASIPSSGTNNKEYNISESDKQLVNEIVDQCNQYSTSSLVQITHSQKPWNEARTLLGGNIISKESIKRYFSEG